MIFLIQKRIYFYHGRPTMTDIPSDALVPFDSPEPKMTIDEAVLLSQVREHIVDGERDQAFKIVCQILNQNDKHPEALYLYATLSSSPDKAIAALQKLLSIQPQHQKANTLLEKLHSQQRDPMEISKPKHDEFGIPPAPGQDQLMQQMLRQQQMLLEQQQRQPIINITNAPVNTNTAAAYAGGGVAVQERNQTAFIVALLVGIFLGTFGVAHIMTGKVGTGILVMLAGWIVWGGISITLIGLSMGIGACIVLPIHLALAYSTANSGARQVVYR
jgi:TM2 domain-containing membrane protein YozV